MRVTVRDIDHELRNKGITLEVAEPGTGGKSLGRLVLGRGKVEWFPGKTSKNCHQVSWEALLGWLASQPQKK